MNTKEIIALGFIANGGRAFRRDICRCDPDVGAVPCEYCATHMALEEAEALDRRYTWMAQSYDEAGIDDASDAEREAVVYQSAYLAAKRNGFIGIQAVSIAIDSTIASRTPKPRHGPQSLRLRVRRGRAVAGPGFGRMRRGRIKPRLRSRTTFSRCIPNCTSTSIL